jgi:glutamate-1-semialdehyde 2,1-aminomutase
MPRCTQKSVAAFERACAVLVGGVDSPVRAFLAVDGTPPTIAQACGAAITDIDGNQYIDYVGSYGPAILGHAAGPITEAITQSATLGTSFGAPSEPETHLAKMIAEAMPSIHKVRFVNSGTEAVMTAIRLARGWTGRTKIIKCIGCYHGHSDAMLVAAGSGALTLGTPSSPGVPAGATQDTLLVPYNDLPAVDLAMDAWDGQIAAVLVEPVAGNMGVVAPADNYLPGLRERCTRHSCLLIFDEVMTGFRLSYGGAQQVYNVRPDVTTLGKIIGGGLPVGAIGGSAAIMDHLSPIGKIYQAGTLSGNPVAMSAGIAALQTIKNTANFYADLETKSSTLANGLLQAARDAGLASQVCVNRAGSMLTLFFAPAPVVDFQSASACNTRAFAAYFNAMLDSGIYLPPSQYEAIFVSSAHSDADIQATIAAAGGALKLAAKLM